MDSDASFGHSNSGLLRFRSATGSFFTNFTDGLEKVGFNGAEGQGLGSRFSSCGAAKCSLVSQTAPQVLQDDDRKPMMNGYGMSNSSLLPPQYPRQSGAPQVGFVDGGGYGVVSSTGMDHHQGQQPKMTSNLMRQNSSPAGLFSHFTSQNDYGTMRGSGSYRVANGSTGDLSPASTGLKGQINYSSSLSSSLGMLSRISEVDNENGGATGTNDEKLGDESGEAQFYSSAYPFGSWSDSSNFRGLKREADSDVKSFMSSQSAELRNRPSILSHHLSLPKASAEMAAMEKLLHFQDTVPCKIRAKRGCATHPRSIAERVRRTRISERMRKLQELVPNMDKQTNTADMLDLAVEYIKDLQQQYKTLIDIRAKCKCSATQKPVVNQTS